MNAALPPLARDIGQAEGALQALLVRLLAPAGLGFPQWATLVLLAQRGALPATTLSRQLIEGGLLADAAAVRETLETLAWEGLIALRAEAEPVWALTAVGSDRFQPLRQAVDRRSADVYGDLPLAELETTHRTLVRVAARARELLAV